MSSNKVTAWSCTEDNDVYTFTVDLIEGGVSSTETHIVDLQSDGTATYQGNSDMSEPTTTNETASNAEWPSPSELIKWVLRKLKDWFDNDDLPDS